MNIIEAVNQTFTETTTIARAPGISRRAARPMRGVCSARRTSTIASASEPSPEAAIVSASRSTSWPSPPARAAIARPASSRPSPPVAAAASPARGSTPCAAPSSRSARSLRLKLVANAPHRLHVGRPRRVRLDLAAQPAHVNRHRVGVAEVLVVPDLVEQLLAGEGPAHRAGEEMQQVELFRRQLHALAAQPDHPPRNVDRQLAEVQPLAVRALHRRGAAQHGLD